MTVDKVILMIPKPSSLRYGVAAWMFLGQRRYAWRKKETKDDSACIEKRDFLY